MEPAKKAAWKCDKCIKTKETVQTKETILQKTELNTFAQTSPESYVTTRRKFKANVSTENSFEALSLDEEDGDLSIILKSASNLNRSCPNIQTNNSDQVEKLEKVIIDLKERLEIAENEISNLLCENVSLKKQVSNYDTQVNQLKDICKSTPNRLHKKTQRVSLNRTKLNFSQLDSTPKLSEEQNKDNGREDNKNPISNPSSLTDTDLIQTESTAIPTKIHTDKTKKPRNVYIFGDEQVKGLSVRLVNGLFGNWHKTYSIQGLVKPYAPSSEILPVLQKQVETLTKDDIIILSVGNNDEDPYTLLANLSKTLGQIKTCKVFILNVYKSQYFHVDELNYEIKMLLKNHSNCKYIKSKDLFVNCNRDKTRLDLITAKLNLEFQYIENEYEVALKNISNKCNNMCTTKQCDRVFFRS